MAEAFPVFGDDRGTLVPMELGDVPFPVRRVFWVQGSASQSERGGHFVGCEQLLVLLTGSVEVHHGPDPSAPTTTHLRHVGERLRLGPDDHVVYRLSGAGAAMLVLASHSYEERRRT